MDARVSSAETEYSGDGCCARDPFCEAHGNKPGVEYFLVRVDASGSASVSVHSDGVCVRDSWSLGELRGLQHLPVRYLLSAEVEQRKDGSSDSSLSSSLSDVCTEYGSEGGGESQSGCLRETGTAQVETPLLADSETEGYGGCGGSEQDWQDTEGRATGRACMQRVRPS